MKGAAILAAVLLPVVVACSGGNQGGPIPQVAEARAERDVVDGAAMLTTTVTVRFDRAFEIVPGTKVPLASHFELEAPDASGKANLPTRVLVRTAQLNPDLRQVILNIDALIPDGTKLKISKQAFQSGAQGEIVVDVQSDMSLAATVLAKTPLRSDKASTVADPKIPDVKPEDRDSQAVRAILNSHLDKRNASAALREGVLRKYDTISPTVVPSPKVRAALAALTGTFAEPAIDSLLTSANCTGKPVAQILIQPPPDAPKLLARVTFTTDGQRIISLNPVLEGDRLERLMPILAHEAIHCDSTDTKTEEVVATAFDTFLYIQLIAVDATIVDTGSPAARENNIDAIAMINSGRRLPESVGVLPSTGIARVLPNSNVAFGSFAELVAAAYPTVESALSTPEAVADAYAARLALAAGIPAQTAFNLKYVDELLGAAMDPRTLVLAIEALGLVPAS